MPAYICVKDRQGNKKTKGILMDRCKWKELEDIVTKNERMAFKAEEHAKYLQQRKDLSAKIQSEMDNTYVVRNIYFFFLILKRNYDYISMPE